MTIFLTSNIKDTIQSVFVLIKAYEGWILTLLLYTGEYITLIIVDTREVLVANVVKE